ncbi:hypothetical protein CH371_18285 [Leptospira wolffii]|uniref:Uncharacterized protein n=1 Tax=Leptospira wolffii TaxID=409998 RepID=A0A2M9Z7I9_9LEPT|nr:hypothetical protein CH371_18285 [Leptospira wolffii]
MRKSSCTEIASRKRRSTANVQLNWTIFKLTTDKCVDIIFEYSYTDTKEKAIFDILQSSIPVSMKNISQATLWNPNCKKQGS